MKWLKFHEDEQVNGFCWAGIFCIIFAFSIFWLPYIMNNPYRLCKTDNNNCHFALKRELNDLSNVINDLNIIIKNKNDFPKLTKVKCKNKIDNFNQLVNDFKPIVTREFPIFLTKIKTATCN